MLSDQDLEKWLDTQSPDEVDTPINLDDVLSLDTEQLLSEVPSRKPRSEQPGTPSGSDEPSGEEDQPVNEITIDEPAPDEMPGDALLHAPADPSMEEDQPPVMTSDSTVHEQPPPPPDVSETDDQLEASVSNDPAAVSKAKEASGGPGGESGTPLYEPADQPSGDLGERLLRARAIDASTLDQARRVQKQTPGLALSQILIDMGVDEAVVQQQVAALAGLPFERVEPDGVDELLLNRIGLEFCKRKQVIPLRTSGARVLVGVTDPQRLFMLDEVRAKLGRPVKVVLVTAADIAAVIEAHTEEESADVAVDDIIKDIQEDDVEVVQHKDENVDLEKQAGESPVIRFVNYLIYDAVKQGASDIHIEPQEKKLRVRYRIDGVLFETMNPPHTMHAAIVSRLKIMANLDISERRLPQDGRIRAMVHGRKLDLRLSTLPTGQGEKAVMRILDARSVRVSLQDLGMPQETLTIWQHQIHQPHGVLLVTGPTGSGKSTTLYASLGTMDRNQLNISTVEDPIEYHLDGINQVQVHEKIKMTFSAALRSLLRQDPDVVMVGEIRDEETGRIAVQAALTGHLVLSTLHTNDAPSSITRLINIGIEPYLIGAAVNGVLAQRLVRRICEQCKLQDEPLDEMREHLSMHGVNLDKIWKGGGCQKCHNTGYSGRVGLYELLVLDDTLRDAVARRPNVTEFRRMCVERGMRTLRADGFAKVAEGRTTVEEVLRVTHSTI
jgi:type IV pilus assembly protein PilB